MLYGYILLSFHAPHCTQTKPSSHCFNPTVTFQPPCFAQTLREVRSFNNGSCFWLLYRVQCSFVALWVLKIFHFIHDCFDFRYKIPVLVLNSAVIPFSYAAFKRDLKNEFKRLICTVTSTKHEQRKTHKNIHIAVARTSLF